MEKKAKIIATLGPAIYSSTKLKQLVNLGVDAFRINFSHKTQGISRIVSRIRKIEKSSNKKLALIADLQGVKLRVGNIKGDSQKIKYNQKYIFDTKKNIFKPNSPWDANTAVAKLLFGNEKKFHLNFPKFQIEKNELSEFTIFLNSGGVINNTFYIPTNRFFFNFLNYIDRILIFLLPGIFALNRSIVLRKIR